MFEAAQQADEADERLALALCSPGDLGRSQLICGVRAIEGER